MTASTERSYIVFVRDVNGLLTVLDEVEAKTTAEAVERSATNLENGRELAAVAKSSLQFYKLATKVAAVPLRETT